jgi:hypothetical protein
VQNSELQENGRKAMSEELVFEIKIVAIGEVRDAEGNLIESVPIEGTRQVTESELKALLEEVEETQT